MQATFLGLQCIGLLLLLCFLLLLFYWVTGHLLVVEDKISIGFSCVVVVVVVFIFLSLPLLPHP